MIVLVSGATTYPRTGEVGHLIVPRQWNDPATLGLAELPGRWALDNGAFIGFDEGAYMRMLEAYQPYVGLHPLFATAPDKVGDAAATLQRWPFWSRLLRGLGWPVAFVGQDGLTPERVPDDMDALFIGGTTAWKESPMAASLCGYARSRGIWVHWGRVNGRRRYGLAKAAGAQSIDGTGFSMYPHTVIPKVEGWKDDRQLVFGREWL